MRKDRWRGFTCLSGLKMSTTAWITNGAKAIRGTGLAYSPRVDVTATVTFRCFKLVIAAGSFAQALLDLPCHPKVLDYVAGPLH